LEGGGDEFAGGDMYEPPGNQLDHAAVAQSALSASGVERKMFAAEQIADAQRDVSSRERERLQALGRIDVERVFHLTGRAAAGMAGVIFR
jgi:hypothetical protein